MDINQLKKFLLQSEQKQLEQIRTQKVETRPQARSAVPGKIKCTRCANIGHLDDGSCPLEPKGLWFCYCCRKNTSHKGRNECPEFRKRYDNRNYDRNNTNNRYRYNNHNNNRFRNDNRRDNRNENDKYDNRNKNNESRGNRGGGKMSGRGKFRNNRSNQKPYNRDRRSEERKDKGNKPTANRTGNDHVQNNLGHKISFIADSGATEHIIGKGFLLSNFEKSEHAVIKSANKNRKADIRIDGKGTLYLKPNPDKDNLIELTNVIAADDISNNLLSLRKFSDAGLGIYLDNKTLRIFEKDSNLEILTGRYEKPNWIIDLSIVKSDELENNYEYYSCMARIVSLDDFVQQSETDFLDLANISSEGDIATEQNPLPIERENCSEIIESDLNEKVLNRKILDLNNINLEDVPENLYISKKAPERNLVRITEGMLWHNRLAHPSLEYLRKLKKSEDSLKNVNFEESLKNCETCVLSKMSRQPCKEIRTRADYPLQRIHSDIMGPISPHSFPGKNRFIIVFIDDFSRFAKVYTLKSKGQAGDCLEQYLQNTRNILGDNRKVCFIRADNAKEYVEGKFLKIMQKEKIDNDFSPTYTPELNGTSERFNLTLEWKIRSLMIDSGLPASMWSLAAEIAVHPYNRTPHKSLDFKTPLELFSPKQKPHLDKLKRFGSLAYVHIPITKTKFSKQAIKAIFVGYAKDSYVLWHPQTGKFIRSKHVRVNEKIVYKDEYKKADLISDEVECSEKLTFDNKEKETEIKNGIETENETGTPLETEVETPIETKKSVENRGNVTENSKRKRKAGTNLGSEPLEKIRKQPKRKAKEGRDFTIYAKPVEIETFVKDTSFDFLASTEIDKSNVIFRDCTSDGSFDNFLENDELQHALLANLNGDPISYAQAISSENGEK